MSQTMTLMVERCNHSDYYPIIVVKETRHFSKVVSYLSRIKNQQYYEITAYIQDSDTQNVATVASGCYMPTKREENQTPESLAEQIRAGLIAHIDRAIQGHAINVARAIVLRDAFYEGNKMVDWSKEDEDSLAYHEARSALLQNLRTWILEQPFTYQPKSR